MNKFNHWSSKGGSFTDVEQKVEAAPSVYSSEESEAGQLILDQFEAAVAHLAQCPAWASISHSQ